MTDTATRLRDKLLSYETLTNYVGARVYQSSVPANQKQAYVWFTRRSTTEDEIIGPAVGADSLVEYFDVECWSTSLDTSQAIAAAVKGLLNNYYTYSGEFGGVNVASIFVTDQSDDYMPQGATDTRIFYSGLTIEISLT